MNPSRMKPVRGPKHTRPAPGGEDFQVDVVGPLTYHYPMPPAKSFGKLIPCDDEMEVEIVTPKPQTAAPAAVRITVTRRAEPTEHGAGNAATLAALEALLRQYAAAGYQIKFELTADPAT
jgi:hypothetical protein